jgi:ABC-2 type transport system ATP-binding protein
MACWHTGQEGEMPPSLKVSIQAEGLEKRFQRTVAVAHLNLEVRRGEIFGLIGPDGAGKTTTVRLLAAVARPTAGRAWVEGLDTVRQAEELRHLVGYMPQRFSLYGDLSVRENLNFFADVFHVHGRERQEQIERLLAFAHLDEFQDRRAAHLSGGMQKKLALACALIHRPHVLFLDEPTTGVDPISRREFWDLLSELHLQGVTLFVTTPYMDEAERCTRIGLMYQGQIFEQGDPMQIRRRVPGELLVIWTADVRRARKVIEPLEGVLETQTYGELLHVFVDSRLHRQPVIEAALRQAGVTIFDLRASHPRIEEAFTSLIRRRQRELEAR